MFQELPSALEQLELLAELHLLHLSFFSQVQAVAVLFQEGFEVQFLPQKLYVWAQVAVRYSQVKVLV